MPVPTTIDDLSTDPVLNSPQGTDPAKGTIDNYFRTHAGFIAQLRDKLREFVSVKDAPFNCKGDGSIGDLAGLNAAAAYADANGLALHIDNPTSYYNLEGGTFLLPRIVRGVTRSGSDPRGFIFQNGTVRVQARSHPDVEGVDANTFICAGLQNGRVHNVRSDTFTVDGYSADWGVFWVSFKNITAGRKILDVSRFAINQNTFENVSSGVPGSYGVLITDGTNTGPTFYEAHGNEFISLDCSRSRGVANISNRNQTNYIIGGYSEMLDVGYPSFVGNWEITGANCDTGGPAQVGLLNHIVGMNTTIERTGGDFLSLSAQSLVPLDWSVRDSIGKPPAMSGSGSCAVVVDAAMPGGSGARYGATTATAFDNVTVTIPPVVTGNATPRFTVAGFWEGDLPAAIEVNNGDGSVASYGNDGFVALGGDYYLFRLTGYASPTVATTVRLFITTSAVSRRGYMGAVYVSAYKAAPLPYKSALNPNVAVWEAGGLMHQKGMVAQGYTASSPATFTVTFPKPYTDAASVIPVIAALSESGFTGKMTRCELTSLSPTGFTALVSFTPDWAGKLYWHASGA